MAHRTLWFSSDDMKEMISKTFIKNQIRGEKTQRQQDTLKNQVKIVNFRMKWVVLPYSKPYTEETKLHMNHLSFFSLDYMPVFLPNLRLMCLHPYVEDLWFLADITTYKILFQRLL